MISVHFETLGCKLNQIETESMAVAFSAAGFTVHGAAENDALLPISTVAICIVNTCTVTGKAEQKARRLIRQLKKQYPAATVLVTGCYAQVDPVAISSLGTHVAVVPGGIRGKIAELPGFIVQSCGGKLPDAPEIQKVQNALYAWPHLWHSNSLTADFAAPFSLSADDFFFHSRASIKIQDGCNNACAYCRICIARGPSVSLDADTVISRLHDIEANGWKEVVLTGVNLSQYRSGNLDFAGLLDRALRETQQLRFRISSLYPERVNDVLLPLLQNPRICPHFHLSIQSGSPVILRAMRRCDSIEDIYYAVEGLRRVKDNPFIACDIITGFPGETEQDFAMTMELCQAISFAGIHAFPFSPRPGTPAFQMKPRVPERIAGERVTILAALAAENRRAYATSWKNRQIDAVTEINRNNGYIRAVTGNYLDVKIPAEAIAGNIPQGKLISVKIGDMCNKPKQSTGSTTGAIEVTGTLVSIY